MAVEGGEAFTPWLPPASLYTFQFYLFGPLPHCRGQPLLSGQNSPQGPGIRLPASQLLPLIPPPRCKTNDTSWTLDRNSAYQGVPGRQTPEFQCLENPNMHLLILLPTGSSQFRETSFSLTICFGHLVEPVKQKQI